MYARTSVIPFELSSSLRAIDPVSKFWILIVAVLLLRSSLPFVCSGTFAVILLRSEELTHLIPHLV